jgi:CBS domain-containing protein
VHGRPVRSTPMPGMKDEDLTDAVPTDMPTDLPTDLATDLATDLPTDLPDDGAAPSPGKGAVVEAAHALRVAEAMTKQVRAVSPDTSIKKVALLMASEAIGAVPVIRSDNHLIGLVTDRDIVIRVCAGDKSVDDIRARDAMTTHPTGITAEESLSRALALMARLQVHRLPVVDDEFRLVGMLSIADIASKGGANAELREALAEISNRQSFWSRVIPMTWRACAWVNRQKHRGTDG